VVDDISHEGLRALLRQEGVTFQPTSRSPARQADSSWLNRIEAQFTALRYFTLDGTDHPSHQEQASMIRRYIIWRNNHAYDERLRRIVAKVLPDVRDERGGVVAGERVHQVNGPARRSRAGLVFRVSR